MWYSCIWVKRLNHLDNQLCRRPRQSHWSPGKSVNVNNIRHYFSSSGSGQLKGEGLLFIVFKLIWPFMTHIFHSLYSNGVNEVCGGEVNYDGVNVPGPLAQWPERDSLQVVTECVLTAGAQGGGVPVLQLRHPPQAGAVLVSSFQVFPPGLAFWCSRSGRDDEHCPVLPFGPALLFLVHDVVVSARAVPLAVLAGLFLHREDH